MRYPKTTVATAAAAGVCLGLVGGAYFSEHGSEGEPRPQPTSTREAQVDTASEAQRKLAQGQTIAAHVLRGDVAPKGGVEGKEMAYNPLQFEDSRLWYAVCQKGGEVALKQLKTGEGTAYFPAELMGTGKVREREEMTSEVANIMPTQEPCGVAALRPGYATPYNQVAYIGTPKGD